MCKIKKYTEDMQSHLNSVLFRFDSYLLEDDKNDAIKTLRDIFGGSPAESFMNDYLQQKLDVDSIASVHDISITEVLNTTVLILRGVKIDDYECEIFVHKYFIALFFRTNGIDLSLLQKRVGDNIVKLAQPVESLCIRLSYSINISNKEIWNVIDKTAFPIMDESVYNGRYTDSALKGNISIDLTRTISPASQSEFSDIVIQTMAFTSLNNMNNSIESIKNMIGLSTEEITRCFIE